MSTSHSDKAPPTNIACKRNPIEAIVIWDFHNNRKTLAFIQQWVSSSRQSEEATPIDVIIWSKSSNEFHGHMEHDPNGGVQRHHLGCIGKSRRYKGRLSGSMGRRFRVVF